MELNAFQRNVRALRENKDVTQEKLAYDLGITPLTVCLWETKGKVPRSDKLLDDLKMYFNCTDQDLFGFGDGFYAKSAGLSSSSPVSSNSYAPVFGNIAAGDPREAIEQQGELHWVNPEVLDRHPGGFFLRVSGDSMDLVLPDGCFAFIAPNEAQSGDIAAVKVNGDEATIKRVKFAEDVVILEPMSTNPEHHRRVIDALHPDAPQVRILGKVVWFDCSLS